MKISRHVLRSGPVASRSRVATRAHADRVGVACRAGGALLLTLVTVL